MRLMGLDVGSKTIGIAVADELGVTAQEVETVSIDETSGNFGLRRVRHWVRHYGITGFVLGLPKNMDGSTGPSVARSKDYGKRLIQKFGLPVYYQDERLTTQQSRRVLIEGGVHDRTTRKKVIDQMAAVLILQTYMEQTRKDKNERED